MRGVRLFLHYGDLADGTGLRRILERVQPDEIYNLGAQSHVRVSFDSPSTPATSTAIGTLRLLEAMRDWIAASDSRSRFYQAGSSEMYGAAAAAAERDDAVPPAQPLRGAARSLAHWYCGRTTARPTGCSSRTASSSTTSRRAAARPSSPARSPRAAARIKLGLQDKLYLGNLDAKRDWGYRGRLRRGDVADAAAGRSPTTTSIATGETHSVREFLEVAFGSLGLDWQRVRRDRLRATSAPPRSIFCSATQRRPARSWAGRPA